LLQSEKCGTERDNSGDMLRNGVKGMTPVNLYSTKIY